MTLAAIVAGIVSFWEESTGADLIQAYPSDWRPDLLYAEWMRAPDIGLGNSYNYFGRKPKTKVLNNGFSNSAEFAGQLQDLLRTVEQTHGIVIDHVVMHRAEGRMSVLYHVPGERVRKHEWAPVAAVAVAAPINSTSEKGVV